VGSFAAWLFQNQATKLRMKNVSRKKNHEFCLTPCGFKKPRGFTAPFEAGTCQLPLFDLTAKRGSKTAWLFKNVWYQAKLVIFFLDTFFIRNFVAWF
jgi:hypothetical protein